ncbi:MAG: hypothetical protein MHM6MM_006088 [Cercozoa sp. M6MM]
MAHVMTHRGKPFLSFAFITKFSMSFNPFREGAKTCRVMMAEIPRWKQGGTDTKFETEMHMRNDDATFSVSFDDGSSMSFSAATQTYAEFVQAVFEKNEWLHLQKSGMGAKLQSRLQKAGSDDIGPFN